MVAFFIAAPDVPTDVPGLCPAETDDVWNIQWPVASPGSTQSVRCPGDDDTSGLGLAHRICMAGGVWGSADASNCGSAAVREVRKEVRYCIVFSSS